MILSDLSIKRPVLAAVMMLTLVTLGIFSYRRLSVEMFPNVEIPVVSIITKYPGAAPESIEREVTKKIEEAVNPIAGVKRVISYSNEGVSTVVVEFQLEEKINEMAQETRSKINAVRGELPQGIEDPIIQKLDFNALPVMSLAVRSGQLSKRDLTLLVEKKIQRRLETIAGVGKVSLVGTAKREVNVVIDPNRIDALGIGVDTVIAGLRGENVNTPLGRLDRGGAEYPLRIEGKPDRVEQFRGMAIAQKDGRPIRLAEVADVIDGVEEERSLALVNGLPAVALDIQKQSGANLVEVVDAVRKQVKLIQPDLPNGVTLDIVRDSSTMTRDSLRDVQETMIIGGILTILIVFIFINSWRSTVITGLTLPISVISSFIVMNALGMTLNVMTLMALSLAIGLLIDDAIVVRENIVRHLEKGEDHFTAARNGTSEIGLAVFATSMSIVAVFVPVAYMKGIVGRFFFSFGITVAFAVTVSLLVSFTLDPMLSSRWHDPAIHREGRRGLVSALLDRFNDWFERIADRYRHLIGWALDHRKTVLFSAFAAFVLGIMIFGMLESAFMTNFDKGEFQVSFKTAPDASLAESRNRLQAMLAAIKDIPEIEHTYSTIGAGDNGTVRSGVLFIKLKERKDRKRIQDSVQQDVRERMARIAGITISIEEAGKVGSSVKPVMVNIRGENIALLKKYSAELKARMGGIPGIVDMEATMENDIPEYRLIVDREKAIASGISSERIVRSVSALVGGEVVSTYEDEDGDAVNIRVRLPGHLRGDPSQVQNLQFTVQKGNGPPSLMPLSNIARYTVSDSPSEINRQALTREVTIGANLDGLPLGTAVARIRMIASEMKMEPGYKVVFSGEAADMEESFMYMAESLLLAIILVYLILAAQFESFFEPFAIMLSLPLSIVGMAGMLYLTGDTVNIMSLIGLIMLMGLVTKNAILLVDYAKVLQEGGMARHDAVVLAGRTRLRPILMTTLAMVFGMMPLAFALGSGSEMRAPMARAVVGGLLTSTVLTLLVVPVMYTLLDDVSKWLKRKAIGSISPIGPMILIGPIGLIGLIGLMMLPTPVLAEQPAMQVRVLTLDSALAIARENNRDIQKAKEYRQWVQGKYIEERSNALPRFSLNGSVYYGLDKTMLLGPGMSPSRQRVYSASVDVEQPLFTWGKLGAAIRIAEEGISMADEQLRAYRQSAYRDVSTAFYDVLLAKELSGIAGQNLAQKERHLDEARKKREAGIATDYDVLAAEVAVQNARPEVIRAGHQIGLALDRLRFLLALRDSTQRIDVEGQLQPAEAASGLEAEGIYAAALANRPERKDIEHRTRISRDLISIANADDKPTVAFKGGYGLKSFEMSPFDLNGKTWNAGIFLSFPFFDGMRGSGRRVQAESDLRSIAIDEARLKDTLSLQSREAADAVQEAKEIVDALTGTVKQAERLLALSEKGYELGVKVRLDVEDAELKWMQAKGNLSRAWRDYRAALVTTEWVMGTAGEGR